MNLNQFDKYSSFTRARKTQHSGTNLLLAALVVIAIIVGFVYLLQWQQATHAQDTSSHSYDTAYRQAGQGSQGIPPLQRFSFVGCFNDSVNNRTFTQKAPDDNYTIEQCYSVAAYANSPYFAMQFPEGSNGPNKAQCFFGIGSNYAAQGVASCPIALQDQYTRSLGDRNVNAVYQINPAAVTPTVNPGSFSYVGCYEDRVGVRALPSGNGAYTTVNSCYTRALQAGATYFGMEYPSGAPSANSGLAQCWYGNAGYAKYGPATCSTRDSNNNYLGESNILAVYQIRNPQTVPTTTTTTT